MSCNSTPDFNYPSRAQSPYVPQSPQSSCHSSVDLADTFINSHTPTPQLAVRSADAFPETEEETFLRMRARVVSRVARMWEVLEEEAICHFRVGRVTLDCLEVETSATPSFVGKLWVQVLTEPVVWLRGRLCGSGSRLLWHMQYS